MLKRLHLYFQEMYPIIPRLMLSVVVFEVIYYIILMNYGITSFDLGVQELVGIFTVFGLLLITRIQDDFKDLEADKHLKDHKDRVFPSGKVKQMDLNIVVAFMMILLIGLNLRFMNNYLFFFISLGFILAMSRWFFMRKWIQPNLVLALITHNPVQMTIALYVISFVVKKYELEPVTLVTVLTAFSTYLPALIWEVGRKIKAPIDENEYTTYSKLFGYEKVVIFIMFVCLTLTILTMVLLYNINKIALIPLGLVYIWLFIQSIRFLKDPLVFGYKKMVELYIYGTECIPLMFIIWKLLGA